MKEKSYDYYFFTNVIRTKRTFLAANKKFWGYRGTLNNLNFGTDSKFEISPPPTSKQKFHLFLTWSKVTSVWSEVTLVWSEVTFVWGEMTMARGVELKNCKLTLRLN